MPASKQTVEYTKRWIRKPCAKACAFFNVCQQCAMYCKSDACEKVTEKAKKKKKKVIAVLKKQLPLQCFNKQMIVLQI